jgi:tetratricopeptide (TPR) repeat protein
MNRISVATFILVTMLACGARGEDGGARERTFVRGLEQFDAAKTPEDYRHAAETWRGIVDADYQNGAVYYNAGNAFMRAGQFGRAIAAYRKAKLYRPRDPFLEANLRQALVSAPGHLNEAPAPWWTFLLFWTQWLSMPEKMYGAAALWTLGALLVFAGYALRKRAGYWASGAACVLALLMSVDAAAAYAEATHPSHAVVAAETIARKGMGETYEPAFNQPLKDGAEVTVLERNGAWVLASVPGAGTGWVRRENLAE